MTEHNPALNGHVAGHAAGNGHASETPQPPPGARWGPETALSLHFFGIGEQRMPIELIRAMAHLKWAAAVVNGELGVLPPPVAQAIAEAAARVAEGGFDAEFPLSVWQTGSGTHSHMNLNEVIATLANESTRARRSGVRLVDAHDFDHHLRRKALL